MPTRPPQEAYHHPAPPSNSGDTRASAEYDLQQQLRHLAILDLASHLRQHYLQQGQQRASQLASLQGSLPDSGNARAATIKTHQLSASGTGTPQLQQQQQKQQQGEEPVDVPQPREHQPLQQFQLRFPSSVPPPPSLVKDTSSLPSFADRGFQACVVRPDAGGNAGPRSNHNGRHCCLEGDASKRSAALQVVAARQERSVAAPEEVAAQERDVATAPKEVAARGEAVAEGAEASAVAVGSRPVSCSNVNSVCELPGQWPSWRALPQRTFTGESNETALPPVSCSNNSNT
eukprot:341519-Pelagomonas_calceolata.AAC.1